MNKDEIEIYKTILTFELLKNGFIRSLKMYYLSNINSL